MARSFSGRSKTKTVAATVLGGIEAQVGALHDLRQRVTGLSSAMPIDTVTVTRVSAG